MIHFPAVKLICQHMVSVLKSNPDKIEHIYEVHYQAAFMLKTGEMQSTV